MKTLSITANLSVVYTNHSLRATCVTLLDSANIEGRHIISVTQHKSEGSLKPYMGHVANKKKKEMSAILSTGLSASSEQTNASPTCAKLDNQPLEPSDYASGPICSLDKCRPNPVYRPKPASPDMPSLTNSQVVHTLNDATDNLDDDELDSILSHINIPEASVSHTYEYVQHSRTILSPILNTCQVTINYNIIQK